MKMSLSRAALAAAVLGVVLAPAPAFAQKLAIADGQNDAWEEIHDQSTGDFSYVKAGSPVNSDVVRTVVRHKAHTVTVSTSFVNLRNNAEGLVVGTRIRTNEGLHRDVWLMKDGSASGSHVLLMTPRGKTVSCPGLSRKIDWAGDQATVTVPRACLSAPRWIEVVTAAGNYASEGMRSYIDVVGKAGYRFSGWSEKVRRG